MDFEKVKQTLESNLDPSSLRPNFYNSFVLSGLSVDIVEHGRVLGSLTVPHRLRNDDKYLHGGVIATLVDLISSAVFFSSGYLTSGVSLDLNVSYLAPAFVGEEIEIEAKLLQGGKAVGITTVEVRKKKTGKLIAQGRHTKYLAISSKL